MYIIWINAVFTTNVGAPENFIENSAYRIWGILNCHFKLAVSYVVVQWMGEFRQSPWRSKDLFHTSIQRKWIPLDTLLFLTNQITRLVRGKPKRIFQLMIIDSRLQ